MAHSPIGPSSAKRILACPGSVALIAKAPPQEASPYAEEGTKAHEVAEAYVLGKPLPSWATDEMIDGAKMYAGLIEDLLLNSNSIQLLPTLEARVLASSIRDDAYGTCDAFFVADNILYVLDYKFGKGVKVIANENEQLLYYAAAILDSYSTCVTEIKMYIVQPRLGGVSEWVAFPVDIIRFRERMENALTRSDLNINEGCKWCPASAFCPERLNEIKDKFNIFPEKLIAELPSVENISPEQFKIYLYNAEILSSWIAAIKSQAFSAIGRGMIIDGYELTESLGNRKWKDEEFAKRNLGKLYDSNLLYDLKFKSPAQLEKVIPKEEVALLVTRESSGKKLSKTENKAPDLFNAFTSIGE